MTDKTLRKILDDLNHQKMSGQVITRPLTNKVELAKIWQVPLSEDNIVGPEEAYLIKEGNDYIGAVLEHESGLFAYIKPAYRRKGRMKGALQKTILPHILQKIPVIRLHLSAAKAGGERSFNIARKLALAVGFEDLQGVASGSRLTMDASNLKERIFIKGTNTGITPEGTARLKNRLLFANALIAMVQTELEYKCGISVYSEELNDLAKALSRQTEKLDNAHLVSIKKEFVK